MMLSGIGDILVIMLSGLSTRSVGANLARRFNAGEYDQWVRRVATMETGVHASLRDAGFLYRLFPALKYRAKFTPTLRVEDTRSKLPKLTGCCSETDLNKI